MRLLVPILISALLPAGPAFAADAAAGEKVFAVCRSCHQVGRDAANGVGPVHNGLVGRKAATYPGYSYSAAMKNSGLTWDAATLDEYLRDPKAMVPGTKMLFAGIRGEKQRQDLIAYLKLFDATGAKAAP